MSKKNKQKDIRLPVEAMRQFSELENAVISAVNIRNHYLLGVRTALNVPDGYVFNPARMGFVPQENNGD